MIANMKQFVLLKFADDLKHLAALREEGLVYMKPLDYFRKLEDEDEERGDKFEGSSRIWQPHHMELTLDVAGVGLYTAVPGEITAPIRYSLPGQRALNVFCTTAIELSAKTGQFEIDKATAFRPWVTIIAPKLLSARLEAAANRMNFSFGSGFVEYYEGAEYTGETGPFRKRTRFRHQQEFRFIIDRGTTICETLSLWIGSLEDISTPAIPSDRINEAKWQVF